MTEQMTVDQLINSILSGETYIGACDNGFKLYPEHFDISQARRYKELVAFLKERAEIINRALVHERIVKGQMSEQELSYLDGVHSYNFNVDKRLKRFTFRGDFSGLIAKGLDLPFCGFYAEDSRIKESYTNGMKGCDLSGSYLLASHFFTKMDDAKFDDCYLGSSYLGSVSAKNMSLKKANLTKANCTCSDFSGSNMAETVLDEAIFNKSCLQNANLTNVCAEKSSFVDCDLRGIELGPNYKWNVHGFGRHMDINGIIVSDPELKEYFERLHATRIEVRMKEKRK